MAWERDSTGDDGHGATRPLWWRLRRALALSALAGAGYFAALAGVLLDGLGGLGGLGEAAAPGAFWQRGALVVAVAVALLGALWWGLVRPLALAVEAEGRRLAQAQARLHHDLLYDGLTGLANRRQLMERLLPGAQGASRGEALGPAPDALGLLYLDLLDFREINTAHGWSTGDAVLRHVACVLRDFARSDDVVARIAPDDFVLATRWRSHPAQLQDMAVDLLGQLSEPVVIDGREIVLEPLVGIAAREGGESVERLLANAQDACRRARREGGAVYYSSAMGARLAARRQTAHELARAVANDEIEPFFQPQIDARTGRLTGVEALARWRSDARGILSPFFVLGGAATPRLGQRITPIIVAKSLAALRSWREQGFEVPAVGLNLTARELRDPAFCDTLLFDLDRAGLTPRDISIEVLESALVTGEDDPLRTTVARLSEAGCRIDLDDFGTGHASLANLRELRVDRLKIDRSFVRDIHRRPSLRKMTVAIIDLARTLDIGTVAEGVETPEEWQTLVELGCSELQGFAIGHPMPAEALPRWLAGRLGRDWPPGAAVGAAVA